MDIAQYKEQLEAEKELLEKQLEGVAVENEHAEGGWQAREDDFSSEPPSVDPVEVGAELESLTRNESITNELEERYHMVEDALERIEHDSFGLCIQCGEKIEKERLDANPAAPTCIAHMEE
jgi:RNA polymerase-binding transcription factor DksA